MVIIINLDLLLNVLRAQSSILDAAVIVFWMWIVKDRSLLSSTPRDQFFMP